MSTWRAGFVAVASVTILACGSSEPRSPLILGDEAKSAQSGPRTLTASQTGALKQVIESAGELCDEINRTFLRDVSADFESWDVRCSGRGFNVMVFADGTAAAVAPCFSDPINGACSRPYRERRRALPESGPSGNLNPDLRKLLEPMTAKDGKAD